MLQHVATCNMQPTIKRNGLNFRVASPLLSPHHRIHVAIGRTGLTAGGWHSQLLYEMVLDHIWEAQERPLAAYVNAHVRAR